MQKVSQLKIKENTARHTNVQNNLQEMKKAVRKTLT